LDVFSELWIFQYFFSLQPTATSWRKNAFFSKNLANSPLFFCFLGTIPGSQCPPMRSFFFSFLLLQDYHLFIFIIIYIYFYIYLAVFGTSSPIVCVRGILIF